MQPYPAQLNKTIGADDMKTPEVARAARELSAFGHRLWFRGIPFAVNGVLKRRWRIRWNKLWEYSRGLAYGNFQNGQRVLDFGGGATIPIFYLAQIGCDVLSLDIDERLANHTNAVAKKTGWKLAGSTFDLTQAPPLDSWQPFDRVISFCVIEHLPRETQILALRRLALLLKPGGVFELTFDYGVAAPVPDAPRDPARVEEFSAATGLKLLGDGAFHDSGDRFALDRKYPTNRFSFGSLFLTKS